MPELVLCWLSWLGVGVCPIVWFISPVWFHWGKLIFPLVLGPHLVWISAGPKCAVPVWEFTCVSVLQCLEDPVSLACSIPTDSQFPYLLFHRVSWAFRGLMKTFKTGRSKVYSFSAYWPTMGLLLVPIYCRRKLLWRWVREILIYGYVGIILLLCSFGGTKFLVLP